MVNGRSRLRACLRVLLFCGVVLAVCAVLLVHHVRARTDAALTRVGRLLMEYTAADHQQPARTLVLNGAQIELSVGSTTHSVATVLDHFHRRCEASTGQLGQQLLEVTGSTSAQRPPQGALLDGVYRVGDESRGVVACIDVGQKRLSLDELTARANAFAQTGDLAAFGQLRFVTVERGAEHTVFVAMWTDGHLPLRTMFPEQGDAPGHDVVGVPRPERSRRVLSSWEVGQPKSVQLYSVSDPDVAAIQQRFRTQLSAAGFALLDRGQTDAAGFVATRGEQAVLVTIGRVAGDETFFSISSLSDATGAVTVR